MNEPLPPPVLRIDSSPKRRKRVFVGRSDNAFLRTCKIVLGGVVGIILGCVIAFGIFGRDPLGVFSSQGTTGQKQGAASQQPSNSQPRSTANKRRAAQPPLAPRGVPSSQANHLVAQPIDKAPDAPTPLTSLTSAPATIETPKTVPPDAPKAVEPMKLSKPPLIAIADDPDVPGKELRRIYIQLSTKLEEDVLSLDTEARREEAHKAMIAAINKEHQRRPITFHFRIADVSKIVDRRATLTLDSPEELKGIRSARMLFAKFAVDERDPKWNRDRILSINKDDVLEITGTPALYTNQFNHKDLLLILKVPVLENKTDYYLYLDLDKSKTKTKKPMDAS